MIAIIGNAKDFLQVVALVTIEKKLNSFSAKVCATKFMGQ